MACKSFLLVEEVDISVCLHLSFFFKQLKTSSVSFGFSVSVS